MKSPNLSLDCSFTFHQASGYENMSKQELIIEIKQKDEQIMQLKQQIKILKENISKHGQSTTSPNLNYQNQKIALYKAKLEEEIAQNQKAVKAFSNITEVIINIIGKFQVSDKSARQSLTSFGINLKSSATVKFNQDPFQREDQSNEDSNDSQFSCIDEIVTETLKLLEYLSSLTQQTVKTNTTLKSELAKRPRPFKRDSLKKSQTEQDFKQSSSLSALKNDSDFQWMAKQSEQQNRQLKQQINDKMAENKQIRRLFSEQEQRRNKLIKAITSCLSQETAYKISQMNREQLLQHIKLMNFRIKQLQKDKRELYAQSKIDRQSDVKKFQDLLQQVKIARGQRLNMSMS